MENKKTHADGAKKTRLQTIEWEHTWQEMLFSACKASRIRYTKKEKKQRTKVHYIMHSMNIIH